MGRWITGALLVSALLALPAAASAQERPTVCKQSPPSRQAGDDVNCTINYAPCGPGGVPVTEGDLGARGMLTRTRDRRAHAGPPDGAGGEPVDAAGDVELLSGVVRGPLREGLRRAHGCSAGEAGRMPSQRNDRCAAHRT